MAAMQMKVTVTDIQDVAPSIKEFTLSPVDKRFSAFSPGSHIVVEMNAPGRKIRNAYSLLSDPSLNTSYKIAVRYQPESRGGSIFMHENVKKGDQLLISPPANLFAPDWQAKHHILLAGGVGITPFMSYIPEMLRREDLDFELHYMYRSSQTGAYVNQLNYILGDRIKTYDSDNSNRANIRDILSNRPQGTHVYICGPESLIEDVVNVAKQTGWPLSHIHYEAFAAPKPGQPFVVELQKTKQTVYVNEDQSLLEALEAAGLDIPNMCRAGVCGQCITPVLEGDIEHRDEFLSEKEHNGNRCIMPCVSRSKGSLLQLNL
ncbi:PDR/VanB family oxidoreductase [Hydrogenovibrio sp. JE_KL2]|uniref:PDR/VanB family oxidoreductase n=1 Tax=Hydrogenovibrio sp. JE_KL2 TaxID=2651188 RepID=UPI00128D70E7|nr:PDR/VanB family oxidoreductase [Hydrogenovibrio sp. JE_KL2]MPQ77449.1 oxidoreductase [Hydrogenovibrio sp. JE_KL2]